MEKSQKIGAIVSICIVFIIMEGFFFLPDSMVVPLPGHFRISDLLIFIVLITFALSGRELAKLFDINKQIYLIVLSGCLLFILTAIMASFHFGQTFTDSILIVRGGFNYLLFFSWLTLLNSRDRVHNFIKISAIFVFIVAIAAIIQKAYPDLAVFRFQEIGLSQYTEHRHIRFGDYRLFFPHISFALLFYFMLLADILHAKPIQKLYPKLFFLGMISYVVIASGTRGHVISVALVTAFAFLKTSKKTMKISGLIFIFIALIIQAFSLAINDKGIAIFEESKLSQLFQSTTDLEQGSIAGRLFQHSMYMDNFLKSPLVGVGTLRFNPDRVQSYKKHGMYQNNDLGYSKILAEYGLIGLTWVFWLYMYVFIRSRKIYKKSLAYDVPPWQSIVARGVFLFYMYIFISTLTLPHFIEGYRIIPIILSFVFLAVANKKHQNVQTSPSGSKALLQTSR